MTRPLTAAMSQALLDGRPLGLFISIEHPAGTGYFCTGIGTRDWNGQTWTGTGNLISVTPVKHSSEIAIQDIVFRITGIDADIVAQIDDDVRNLGGAVWLACFNDADQVIADPYQVVDSSLDTQSFTVENDGTATIDVIAHSGFYTLDRGVDEAWTPENQRLTYPDDVGLDMIPELQNQTLLWTP